MTHIHRKIKVYIASPYTIGDKVANVNVQIDAFSELMDEGYLPFAPLLSHYIEERHPKKYEYWIEIDKAWVKACDCVLRLPGDSSGADGEVELAEIEGKPVFFSIVDLYRYYMEVHSVSGVKEKELGNCSEILYNIDRTTKEKYANIVMANIEFSEFPKFFYAFSVKDIREYLIPALEEIAKEIADE